MIFLVMMFTSQVSAAPAVEPDHCNDRPDWPGVTLVKTGDNAMRIAFALWRAQNPAFKRDDEKVWASGFTAALHGCVWEVSEKPEPPRESSTFTISIGAVDGRFLGALITD
ncbi:MAG: hypothetical protein ACJ8IR_08545 [Alphaproteobacteria bacterium]